MTTTPWGPADELRSRKLRPGPGESPDVVARSQLDRLMGATVAVVAQRGYETTRVADILEVAGVSRSAYYRHFSNKEQCFLATLDALLARTEPILVDAYRRADGPWEDRLRALLGAVVEMVAAQPAAARVWFIDAPAAGSDALARVERLDARLLALVTDSLQQAAGRESMPPAIVGAILGGVRTVVQNHVRRENEEGLFDAMPALIDWTLGYEPPSRPLRRPRKAPALPAAPIDPRDAEARILQAVTELIAERGYLALTITEIAKRGGVSLSTFYALFESKEAVFLAALDEGERRLAEAVLPYVQGAPDWPQAIKDVTHAVFAFLASNPAIAKLGGLDIYAGGPAALERQERTRASFETLLYRGFQAYPDTTEVAAEAVGSAISALVFDQLRRAGAERLYEVAPIAVFIALAPFVGSEMASSIANESWKPAA
jgi:AcrR family transcriptional regulator